jgi:adenine deaminase
MSWRRDVIQVDLGKKAADLVITNGSLVNVLTGEVYPADVSVVSGRVAAVGKMADGAVGPRTEVIDASRAFLVPGLIDAHMHTESSGVTLTQLARILLPRGVTTIMYAHEIANVLGVPGMELVREERRQVPLKVFFEAPTSVPWATGLELPAAVLSPEDVAMILEWPETVALGESDYFDVVAMDEGILRKIEAAHEQGLPVNGHAAMAPYDELMAVIAGGFDDDHENYAEEEVLAKLRLGMKVMLREANIPWLASAVTQHEIDTRNLLLCIDDKLVNVLVRQGGVDNTVRTAVAHGIAPLKAIQMATINAATHFRLDLDLGSISPGKIADILVTDSLTTLAPKAVVANGQLMARDGQFLPTLQPYRYPEWAKGQLRLARRVTASDFEIQIGFESGRVDLRVLKVSGGGWVKTWAVEPFVVEGGSVLIDVSRSHNLVAVVESHGKDGNIARGVVEGIGLHRGAVASSVSHDCHNITVVGANPEDMAVCVNALADVGGGFAAASQGRILAMVELEVAGLVSDQPYEEIVTKLDNFEEVIRSGLGFPSDIEFVVFNFLALQSSPFQAAITDRGLIDTYARQVLPLVVSASEGAA